MNSWVLSQLHQARSERESWDARGFAEKHFTPTEFADLARQSDSFAPFVSSWIAGVMQIGFVDRETEPYTRVSLHRDIDFFTDAETQAQRKALIVAFCGNKDRLAMPIACFLQHLRSTSFDVAILRDPSRTFFTNGLGEMAMLELIEFLRHRLQPGAYERVFCFGTSSGGPPALRYALMLSADRGISASGLFPWHVRRLTDPSQNEIQAFDLLCACRDPQKTELYCAFSAENKTDRHAARLASLRVPAKLVAIGGFDGHNFLFELSKRKQLADFFAEIFPFGSNAERPSSRLSEISAGETITYPFQ
jgi:hypothetical protein